MTLTIIKPTPKKRVRSPEVRKQHILKALHAVLTERGLAGTHLLQVAQTAGVSKYEVVRQFGSITNLLSAYVLGGYFIPLPMGDQLSQLSQLQGGRGSGLWNRMSQQLVRHWRASKASREILQFSVADAPQKLLALERTKQECFELFAGQLTRNGMMLGGDERACLAIILGGLSFLTIQAHHNQPFLGIDLRSDDGWLRIERAMKLLYERLEESAPRPIDKRNGGPSR